MKKSHFLGLMLAVLLLFQAAGSGFAGGSKLLMPQDNTDFNASPGANAPWFNIDVDTPNNEGQHTSAAFDPSRGWTYISYYDATNQRLRMARLGGPALDCDPISDWGCLTIDSGPDVGKSSSIAVNPTTGGIGIAYHDATNGKLKYAYFKNPNLLAYTINTIDKGIFPVSSTGLHTSLKYDSDGTPFIAYYFENSAGVDALVLAYYSVASGNCVNGDFPSEWRCETIITGEGVGQYASLFVVEDWEFRIAYYDADKGELWYATSKGEGNCGYYGTDWVCYPISGGTADVGRYASLYVDNGDHFHIAYYDATNKKLKYAHQVNSGGNCGIIGSAQCDTIDSMPADVHPLGISIAEDSDGYPIIAYQSTNGSLKVARPLAALGLPAGSGNCGPENPFSTWYCQTINPQNPWVPARHGAYLSLAVSPSGLATVAYNGFITSSGGNLMVAYQQFQIYQPLVMKGQ
jgi:hypothetical protein